jgi:glycosyltransferase involved in cell wall biosynthesis
MGLLYSLPKIDKQGWPWNEEVSESLYKKDIQWPRITIVTPSYNQGRFIEETIRSILLQNYPNLEYIIIDAKSNDDTLEIIQKYNPYIQYWISEKDHGQSDALIKGFEKASGYIMNWINSDDILCKDGLYHIAQTFIDHPDADFVYGKNGIMDIDSRVFDYMQHPKDNLPLRYLYEMPYGQQACFFTRKIYIESGGINRDIHFSMDYELYLKMHLLDIITIRIDEPIGNIRIHDDTKTAQQETIMRQENGNAFMTFLNSIQEKRKSNFFASIGHKPYKVYKVKRKLHSKRVKEAMLMYLQKNIWYYYNIGNIHIALKIVIQIIKMDIKYFLNPNYIKIIKDGTISILQSSRSR